MTVTVSRDAAPANRLLGGALGRAGGCANPSLGNANVQQIVDVRDAQITPRKVERKREHAHRAARRVIVALVL